MATETQYVSTGTNVDNSGGTAWNNPSNVEGSANDNVYATVVDVLGGSGEHSDHLNMDFAVYSLTESIQSVTAYVECKRSSGITSNSPYIYFYNSTDGWCAGHLVSSISTSEQTRSATCSHFSWNATKIDSIQLRFTIENYNSDPGGTIYADRAWVTVIEVITVPDAPADPTISATAVKTMSVSSANPASGSPFTDVEIQISTSATFASGNITWVKGSAPSSPQTHDFVGGDGVVDDTLYYTRARYQNSGGWGDYNASPYNSATSYAFSDTVMGVLGENIAKVNGVEIANIGKVQGV